MNNFYTDQRTIELFISVLTRLPQQTVKLIEFFIEVMDDCVDNFVMVLAYDLQHVPLLFYDKSQTI